MDRWKFVNEKWIPRPSPAGKGVRLLSEIACVRRSSNKCGEAASSLPPHYYESRLSGWAGSEGSEGSTGVEGTHNSYSVPIPHIYNFAALLILMRRTTPFEPFEPIEPVEPMH